jgi:hypothetical protein
VDDAPGLGIAQVQAIVEGCRNDRTVAPDDELHDDPSAEGGASAEGALVARAHATERGPDDALDLEWLDASEVVVDGLAALKCRLRRHEHPDRMALGGVDRRDEVCRGRGGLRRDVGLLQALRCPTPTSARYTSVGPSPRTPCQIASTSTISPVTR